MGVWIETPPQCLGILARSVTPCMGVWIETFAALTLTKFILSHPVWVCGLKLYIKQQNGCKRRHTLYGCVD